MSKPTRSKSTSTRSSSKSKSTRSKGEPTKSIGSDRLMQFVVPAIVGAVISAAAFAAFMTFGPRPAPGPAFTSSPAGKITDLSDAQKATIEQTVRDYLLKNPQILMQMSEALEKQQVETQNLMVKTAISQNSDMIYRDNYGLEAGNPEGDVTIVEFSDYNCPYCKQAFKDVVKIINSDKKVRIVFKEFPIFGERSEAVARVAIAAQAQGKYFELHAKLMKNRGQNTVQKALRMADRLGLDIDRLKQDMESDEVRKIVSETRELGARLGIRGTPYYLVGDRSIPGAARDLYQQFQKNLADVRENGCQVTC